MEQANRHESSFSAVEEGHTCFKRTDKTAGVILCRMPKKAQWTGKKCTPEWAKTRNGRWWRRRGGRNGNPGILLVNAEEGEWWFQRSEVMTLKTLQRSRHRQCSTHHTVNHLWLLPLRQLFLPPRPRSHTPTRAHASTSMVMHARWV